MVTNVPEPEPDADLGILVGLIVTDGSIGEKEIEFTGKSKRLHKIFEELMRKKFGVKKFWRGNDSRDKEIKRTKVFGKKISKDLREVTKNFSEWVFKLKKEEIRRILQVMFSTDGCITLWPVWNRKKGVWEIKKCVKFTSKSKHLREVLFKMLTALGFQPTERENNDEVVLFKKEDIIKFAKEIGFVPGVKVTKNSRNWHGFEKNQVLDLAVKAFELKKKDLENFKTKEEVIDFLKSLLKAPASDCKRPRVQVPTD